MASVRLIVVLVLVCALIFPSEEWFGSRRRRRRRRAPPPPPQCPTHTSALPGAINSWDQPFAFQCPGGQAISRVQSVHCNIAEDRVWRFECKPVPGLSDFKEHFWTPWVNEYDGVMDFTCPFNSLVTGFRSEHSNGHQDRRWKVRCSKGCGMVTYNHALTAYQNGWDGAMDYSTDNDYYLRGIHGYHDNGRGDRRYKFDICKVLMGG